MDHRAVIGGALQQQDDSFAGLEIPAALVPSLDRHRQNLARLVLSLHSLGLDEKQIESSVSVIVDSYKEELLCAIRTMGNLP